MSESEDITYDNSHRAFLQSFLSRATLTFDQAKPILAAILSAQDGREIQDNDIQESDLQNFVHTINASISPLDLEIRSTLSQHDKTRVWALVNTTSDAITQLATTHTPDEIAFVKRLLDQMFDANNTHRAEIMAVGSTKALQLAKVSGERDGNQTQEATQGAAAQSLTMMQAQRMLASLVDEGWLECSPKEYYCLTPRALMELRGWLIDTYNDDDDDKIKFCRACRDIVTIGERCPNLDCAARLHYHCTRNTFRAENADRCPLCKTAWENPLPVGEKAATGYANRRNTDGTSRRSTTQGNGADESEEESDEG